MLTPISKAMKYLLFLFNFIFVLTGIALITVGLTIKSENDNIKDAVDEEYLSAPNLLIFIGCFVFIVSFFGCCGALRESHFMIFTFSVIMAAIFVAEVSVGIMGYTHRTEAKEELVNKLTETMQNYSKNAAETELWDTIQGKLSCCGAKNYTEWQPILHYLPITCCTPKAGSIGVVGCNVTSPNLHKTPCVTAIGDVIQENLSTIGFTGIAIGVVQLIGVLFSCKLAYSIRQDYVSV